MQHNCQTSKDVFEYKQKSAKTSKNIKETKKNVKKLKWHNNNNKRVIKEVAMAFAMSNNLVKTSSQ